MALRTAIAGQPSDQKHYVTRVSDTCHPPYLMWLARVVNGTDSFWEAGLRRMMMARMKDSGSNG